MNLKHSILSLLAMGLSIGVVKAGSDDDAVLKQLQKTKEKLESTIEDRDEFKLTEVPEKWKDESAVILYKYLYYQAERNFNNNFYMTEDVIRVYSKYRIKLQDNFAINDFSEFYFGDRDLLQIKVIKTDGTEYEVDMEEAKGSDTKFDDFLGLSGLSLTIDSYKKIPVPNLDKGDMIEVTLVSENLRIYSGKTYHTNHIPELETLTLAGAYPIMHQFIEFNLEDPFRLNFKSLNGAPALRPIKVKEAKASFIFQDSMRARVKSEYWSGGFGFNPSVKYVITKKVNTNLGLDFTGESMEAKTEVSEEEVLKLANFIYRNTESSSSGVYFDFIKRFRGQLKTNDDYIEKFYYYYRARVFSKDKSRRFNNIQFVMNLSRILKKRNIPFEFLLAVPMTYGGLPNMISYDETIWAIRLKGSEKVYSDFTVYSNPDEMNQHLMGHDIYIIEPAKKVNKMSIRKEVLPVYEPGDNKAHFNITISFSGDLNQVDLKRKTTATGYAKSRYRKLIPLESFRQEREQNGMGKSTFGIPNVFYDYEVAYDRDFLDDESDRIKEAIDAREKDSDKDFVEDDLSGDGLNVKEVKSVNVSSDGRFQDQKEFVFDDLSVIDEVSHKADKYVIFDLGKFLGGQFELTDSEDQQRNQDIYFGFTREYSYEIIVNVPEGYTVSGLESFNRSVDNSTGSFSVSAEQKGNQIIVKSSKKYKGIRFSKDKWDEVKAFIEMASEVSHSKIILTKN